MKGNRILMAKHIKILINEINTMFISIPNEIVLAIFKYASYQDLLRWAQVNKQWNFLANDKSLFGANSMDFITYKREQMIIKLREAVRSRNENQVSTLLSLNADPNCVTKYWHNCSKPNEPLLCIATIWNYYEIASSLIQFKVNVNKTAYNDEKSPLYYAAFFKRVKIAKLLIDNGAEVNNIVLEKARTRCHPDETESLADALTTAIETNTPEAWEKAIVEEIKFNTPDANCCIQ